jgi:hypothetical protein
VLALLLLLAGSNIACVFSKPSASAGNALRAPYGQKYAAPMVSEFLETEAKPSASETEETEAKPSGNALRAPYGEAMAPMLHKNFWSPLQAFPLALAGQLLNAWTTTVSRRTPFVSRRQPRQRVSALPTQGWLRLFQLSESLSQAAEK